MLECIIHEPTQGFLAWRRGNLWNLLENAHNWIHSDWSKPVKIFEILNIFNTMRVDSQARQIDYAGFAVIIYYWSVLTSLHFFELSADDLVCIFPCEWCALGSERSKMPDRFELKFSLCPKISSIFPKAYIMYSVAVQHQFVQLDQSYLCFARRNI